MIGNDGANLVQDGRKVLLSKMVPRGVRVIVEAEPADDDSGRTFVRVSTEVRRKGVDAAPPQKQ